MVLAIIFVGSQLVEDHQVELWGVYEGLAVRRAFGFRDTTIEGVVAEAQMSRLRHFLELLFLLGERHKPSLPQLKMLQNLI